MVIVIVAMSKPLQKKDGKICQCIIVAKSANMDDKIHERDGMLADLGLKSVTGHYHRDGTTMTTMVTALYKWEKRMRIHAVKKKFADYYAANFSTFSMQYPEYDGVLTCYGKDEKMEFLIQLNKIKETDDVDNTNCFFLASSSTLPQQADGSSGSHLKQKSRPNERFTHLLVNYNCSSVDVPFYEKSVFGSLNIDKVDSCWNKEKSCITALLTLRKKRSKAMLRFCINDYNVWFPETPIQLLSKEGESQPPSIFASHKKGDAKEKEIFHSLVKLIRTGTL